MVSTRIVFLATVLMTFGSYSSGRVVPTDIEDEAFIKREGSSMKNPVDMGMEGEMDSVNDVVHVNCDEGATTSENSMKYGMRRCPIEIPCPEGYIEIYGECFKIDPDLENDVNCDEEGETSENSNHGMRRCPIKIPCPEGYIRFNGKCVKLFPDLEDDVNCDEEGKTSENSNHGVRRCPIKIRCPEGYIKINGKCVELFPDLEDDVNCDEEGITSENSKNGMRRCPIEVPCPEGYIKIYGKCFKIDPDLETNEGGKMVEDDFATSNQQGRGEEEYNPMVSYVDVSKFEPAIFRKYRPELRSIIHEIPCTGEDHIVINGRCYKMVIDDEDIEEIKEGLAKAFAKIADLIRCAAEGGKMVGDECVKPNQQDYDDKEYVDISNSELTISRKFRSALRNILKEIPCSKNDYIKIKGHCYRIVIDDEDIEEIKEELAEDFTKVADLIQCAAQGGNMVGDECVKPNQQDHDDKEYIDISNSEPTISRKYRPALRSILNKVPCNGDDLITYQEHCFKIVIDEEDIEEFQKDLVQAFDKIGDFLRCAAQGGKMVGDECVKSSQLSSVNEDYKQTFRSIFPHRCQPGYVKIAGKCREVLPDDEDEETRAQAVENSLNGEEISQESQTPEGPNNGTGLKHIIDVPCQKGYVKVNDKCREIVD